MTVATADLYDELEEGIHLYSDEDGILVER